jgi:hypothetical protein
MPSESHSPGAVKLNRHEEYRQGALHCHSRPLFACPCSAMFAWLIRHQPTVLFSHNKPATSNQPTILFSQNKSA